MHRLLLILLRVTRCIRAVTHIESDKDFRHNTNGPTISKIPEQKRCFLMTLECLIPATACQRIFLPHHYHICVYNVISTQNVIR